MLLYIFLILTKYLCGNIFASDEEIKQWKMCYKRKIQNRFIFWTATNSTILMLKYAVNKKSEIFVSNKCQKVVNLSVKEKSIKFVTLYFSNIDKIFVWNFMASNEEIKQWKMF